jgi:hypothetical protein
MSVSSAKYGKLAEEAGIELKNLDVNKRMSEETWAFTATVYLNGERVATAENRGRGGQTMLRKYADNRGGSTTFIDGRDKLREVVADLPNVDSQIGDEGLNLDAEATVHSLVGHTLHKQKIQRHISGGKVVFRTSDQPEGAFSYVEHRGNPEAALEAMKEKHDVAEVFNDGLTA